MRRVVVIGVVVAALLLALIVVIGCGGEKETEKQIEPTTQPVSEPARGELTEGQKKEIYYAITEEQDKVTIQDPPPPDYREQMDAINEAICSQYNITKEELRTITAKGVQNNWPIPPLPE
ncbi:MAG: hypothetical protein KKB90_09725 [Actinobacteria bacterium]|nr:hypothetical protein [Actinomycetota bacterium]MCG2820129.1 hypothetical protein [Actinomycetes bacterium]MBU4219222.1 hypothetical protein [Actinomycetota bacterium]MBU4359065.1 hypothetical protein [Actinomycetota bacterium]MBU4392924.1 hypothetical protein [Actinomycetota bacterium]